MPTNMTRRMRIINNPAIDPAEIYYLQYGTSEGGPPYEHLKMKLFQRGGDGVKWKPVWEEVWKEVVAAWIKNHPGTRCWAWWEIDAPRWERKFGAWFDGTLPEPRRRIAGIGTPDFEALAYVPNFEKGIPTGFVSKFDEEYYNGRRKDIHGNIIPTKYKEGDFKGKAIDPDDPSLYESETSYLLRHDLLSPQEKKYLASHPELMDPEKVVVDEEEEENQLN